MAQTCCLGASEAYSGFQDKKRQSLAKNLKKADTKEKYNLQAKAFSKGRQAVMTHLLLRADQHSYFPSIHKAPQLAVTTEKNNETVNLLFKMFTTILYRTIV